MFVLRSFLLLLLAAAFASCARPSAGIAAPGDEPALAHTAVTPAADIPLEDQQPYESVMSNPLHDEQWMLQPSGSGTDYQWVAMKTSPPALSSSSSEIYLQDAYTASGVRTGPVYVKTIRQLLAEARNPRDPALRMDAIAAIAKAQFGGDPQYVSLYRSALSRDPDLAVRVAAVRALGIHGQSEDLSRVDALAKNANSVMRSAAQHAASQIRQRSGSTS